MKPYGVNTNTPVTSVAEVIDEGFEDVRLRQRDAHISSLQKIKIRIKVAVLYFW